jgi:hypothetical protein
MRPLTVGELLDAAVTLLRTRWLLLVGLGAAAAAAEQAVLFPLRRLADVNLYYFPPEDRWPAWTLLVAVGFATEAAVIAALGGPASAAAPRALLGDAVARRSGRGRSASTITAIAVVAVLVAFLCGLVVATMYAWPVSFFLLSLVTIPLWLWTYGSLGLAVPAVVIERRGPFGAVGRSVTLSARGFLRTIRVRVLAYLGWWVIRVGWGLGVLSVIGLFYTPPNETMDNVLMAVVYLVVNALAYPTLACLDAVLLLEARMRTEGLDIALRQALRLRVDPTPVLVGRA